MAAVVAPTLSTVWINSMTDRSDYINFPLMTGLQRTRTADGSRRVYGTGRKRNVGTAQVTNDWTLALPHLTAAQILWLENHVNTTVIVRDDRGHRIFATYYSVPVTEHAIPVDGVFEGDLSLNLVELTDTLAV
jgi:hypothetical protein